MISFQNYFRNLFPQPQEPEPPTPAVSLASRAETGIDRAVFALRSRRAILEVEISRRTQELHELETAIEAYEAAQRVFINAQVPALPEAFDDFYLGHEPYSNGGDPVSVSSLEEGQLGFDGSADFPPVSEPGPGTEGAKLDHNPVSLSYPEEARANGNRE